MFADPPAAPAAADPQGLITGETSPYPPPIPSSAAHLADQVESGGAKIEDLLLRINCKYQSLFFAAAAAAAAAGLFGCIGSLSRFDLPSLGVCIFLVIFGFLLMLTDMPGSPRWAGRYRSIIRRHFCFLTRLTMKSLFLLYISCLLYIILSPSYSPSYSASIYINRSTAANIFAAVFAAAVSLVAVAGLLIAIRKSIRLEKLRRNILIKSRGQYKEIYNKYACIDNNHGIQIEEFNHLAADYTAANIQFNLIDLGIIYNALDEHQKSAINEREFTQWMTGTMTYL